MSSPKVVTVGMTDSVCELWRVTWILQQLLETPFSVTNRATRELETQTTSHIATDLRGVLIPPVQHRTHTLLQCTGSILQGRPPGHRPVSVTLKTSKAYFLLFQPNEQNQKSGRESWRIHEHMETKQYVCIFFFLSLKKFILFLILFA